MVEGVEGGDSEGGACDDDGASFNCVLPFWSDARLGQGPEDDDAVGHDAVLVLCCEGLCVHKWLRVRGDVAWGVAWV